MACLHFTWKKWKKNQPFRIYDAISAYVEKKLHVMSIFFAFVVFNHFCFNLSILKAPGVCRGGKYIGVFSELVNSKPKVKKDAVEISENDLKQRIIKVITLFTTLSLQNLFKPGIKQFWCSAPVFSLTFDTLL